MLGLATFLAASLLSNSAEFPDPCEIQGQEFSGFVGGDDAVTKRFWRKVNTEDLFYGPTGAMAPMAGKSETWVVILPCPYVRGQSAFYSLFRDEKSAEDGLPTLFARYLVAENVVRKRLSNARGRGGYESGNSGVSLLEPLPGTLGARVQVSETAGSCFCRKEKG